MYSSSVQGVFVLFMQSGSFQEVFTHIQLVILHM